MTSDKSAVRAWGCRLNRDLSHTVFYEITGADLLNIYLLKGNPRTADYAAQDSMSDYRRIRVSLGYSRLRPASTAMQCAI